MRSSKLEMNLAILRILASWGPMEIPKLTLKTDLSQNVLKQHLDFLIPQNLVEEQNLGKDKAFYVITERGLRVLKIIAPIIKEARKIPALLY